MENKKENRAFNEMYIAAKKRLEGKNPIEIAKNSGAEFDEEKSILKIKSLDAIFELEYPTYDMKEKRDDWQILTLLHYLDLADNTLNCSLPRNRKAPAGSTEAGSPVSSWPCCPMNWWMNTSVTLKDARAREAHSGWASVLTEPSEIGRAHV